MIAIAAVRPDDWNIALFVHVLGAFTLIGALAMASSYLLAARRDGSLELVRLGYRSLLMAALPAWLVTRIGAGWIASKEGLSDSTVTWIGVGYGASDVGFLLLIVATVGAGLAVRKATRDEAAGSPGRGLAIAAGLSAFLIVVYAAVIVVMATKPT